SARGVVAVPLQAHNTSQMAFNPETGLVYVPISAANAFAFTAATDFQIVPGFQTLGLRNPVNDSPPPPLAFPPTNGPVRAGQRGILSAWDPVTQKERWVCSGRGAERGRSVHNRQ